MDGGDAATRLDRHLDALLRAAPADPDGLDADLAATVGRLTRLAADPEPDPAFAAGLRHALLAPTPGINHRPAAASSIVVAARPPALAGPTGRSTAALEGRRVGALLATAALLLLTLAGVIAASRLGGIGQGETRTGAATVAALQGEQANREAPTAPTQAADDSLSPIPQTTSIATDFGAVIAGDPEALDGIRAALDARFGTYPPECRAGFVLVSGTADDLGQGIALATTVRDVAFSEFPDIFAENTGAQLFWNPAGGDQVGEVQLEVFFHKGCPVAAVGSGSPTPPATPTGAACGVEPRATVPTVPPMGGRDRLLADPGDPRAAARLAVLLEAARPVAAAVEETVRVALRTAAACRETGDPAAEAALYTDRFLVAALARAGLEGAAATDETLRRALASAPSLAPDASPVPGRMWRLFTDQIGAVVASEGGPLFVVLSRSGDRWLIDEIAPYPFPPDLPPPAAHELAEGALPPLDLAVVAVSEAGVVPNVIVVPAGAKVRLAVTNTGGADRVFRVTGLPLDLRLRPGETEATWFEFPEGRFDYSAALPGEEAAELNGTLIAIGPEGATPTR